MGYDDTYSSGTDRDTASRLERITERVSQELEPLRILASITPHSALRDLRSVEPDNPFADLFSTWVLFKDESGMDDILEKAGDSLDQMFDFYKIYPINIDGSRKLFLARFELVKYGEQLHYDEAIFLEDKEKVKGFIDFLSGFPMDTPEALLMVGEISSREIYKAGKLPLMDGKGEVTSPVPFNLFEAFDDKSLLLNYLYLETTMALALANNLSEEPDAEGLHWWVRTNLTPTLALDETPAKFPYPGEFFALAIRMMPDKFWDTQESSPFLFAGNWLDTLYYSTGVITEIQEATAEQVYPTYTVKWRKDKYTPVRPTDFTEYKVGDRVVLLKNVETTKISQLWKDDDMNQLYETWTIAPLMFYGFDPEKED